MSEAPSGGDVSVASPFGADLRLMRRVAAGDRDAQRELAVRLSNRTHRTVSALVRHPADASDLLQESLVEVLRSAGSYRGDAPMERWADRIIVRRAMRWLRTERKRVGLMLNEFDADSLAAPALPSSLAERMAQPVSRYLERLSEPLRLVLLLRYGADHTVPEIAAETGATVKRAEKRLMRALALLREMIDRDVDERLRGRS